MSFYRKNNRLPAKEIYQTGNWFFVTICVQNRVNIFGDIIDGEMNLNQVGLICQNEWLKIPEIYENVVLEGFVVMPNHFHGIVGLDNQPINRGTQRKCDLSGIIKYFKSMTTIKVKRIVAENFNFPFDRCNNAENGDLKIAATKRLIENHNTIWQKSFYDHVIRGEKDLLNICEYIQNNPMSWDLDSLNPKNK